MAQNGKKAYELCTKNTPDVVLMDMRMPEYDGAYGIRKIKSEFPQIKMLVLTTFDDEETIEAALSAGADGYILKEMEDEKIIFSIKSVYHGITVLEQSVFQSIKGNSRLDSPVSTQQFTQRELTLIRLVAMLYLAEGTVKNGLSRVLEKLQLKDRTQLAIYALKNGLDN